MQTSRYRKWWKEGREKVRGSKSEGGMVKVDTEKIIGREKEKKQEDRKIVTVRSSDVDLHWIRIHNIG